ncbi:hypothetical protein IH992_04130 [Candidatus Poribacteria bacterium]|nr:hypothetical protein [Candidatus Poribacteria bacterium]
MIHFGQTGASLGVDIPDFIPFVGGETIPQSTIETGRNLFDVLFPTTGSRTSQDPPRPGPAGSQQATQPSSGGVMAMGILPLVALGIGAFLLLK